MEQLIAAFKKFDSDEPVTVELLKGLLTKLQLPCGSDEELAAFIKEVEEEKERCANAVYPEVRGVTFDDGNNNNNNEDDPNAAPRRNHNVGNGDLMTLFNPELYPHYENSRSMWDLWEASSTKFKDNNFWGNRNGAQYEWTSYGDAAERVLDLGAGFSDSGLERQQFVGVMLNTMQEWSQIELALWSRALVPVTLYHTHGVKALIYICNHAELKSIIVGEKNAKLLIEEVTPHAEHLKQIIVVGNIPEDVSIPEGIEVLKFEEVEAKGKAIRDEGNYSVDGAKADDTCFIVYTSGTTGNPKGVVHKHSNMVACLASNIALINFNETDSHIAFLPMAHIMEQYLEGLSMVAGASIGFYSGDVRKLMEDIAILKPTVFIGVPRLLNRLYGGIRGKFQALEGPKKALFDMAWASKKAALESSGRLKSYFDLFIFKSAAAALGGKVRLIATGSAPIDPKMLEFFRIAFSCPVCEGYGMSEVLVTNITPIWDGRTISHVGPPCESIEIKLVSVPEMNYLTTDNPPRGEVCFRGPTVTEGYYKAPEKTKETIDEDGWLHTGDIGQWILPDGHLRVIDRVKHIFKLSQGEYVAPEKVEQCAVTSKKLAQIFVNGNSLHSHLVCVVVPDPLALEGAVAKYNLADKAAAFSSDEFKAEILQDINDVCRGSGLNGFEIPKKIHLSSTPFEELGLLTPTFKLKRNQAREHFKELCESLYEE